MEKDVDRLKKRIKELEDLIEYDHKVILDKITEKSAYLDTVKQEVDAYRKSKTTIDEHNKLLDKIGSMREELLDIAEEKFPALYDEFSRDVYDSPYETLLFVKAFIKEITRS